MRNHGFTSLGHIFGGEPDPLRRNALTLEAVMDRDVVDGLSQHKTDQCNDVQICQSLR
jgi:hypothetical protein